MMQFLIDGHRNRVALRAQQWPEGVRGQLLTPLTRYSRGHDVYAIDNGAFSSFREHNFRSLLKREYRVKDSALFVCMPDKVGDHKRTLELWEQYQGIADGYKLAFVAQDGYEGFQPGTAALFIGGTDAFKNSAECIVACTDARARGMHVHIGRVNGPERFMRFIDVADTCDGSGVSRYDYMIERIREAVNAQRT